MTDETEAPRILEVIRVVRPTQVVFHPKWPVRLTRENPRARVEYLDEPADDPEGSSGATPAEDGGKGG